MQVVQRFGGPPPEPIGQPITCATKATADPSARSQAGESIGQPTTGASNSAGLPTARPEDDHHTSPDRHWQLMGASRARFGGVAGVRSTMM